MLLTIQTCYSWWILSIKCHSLEIVECSLTVFNTFAFLAFPKAQTLHSWKIPITITSISFAVSLIVALDWCPNNSCDTITFIFTLTYLFDLSLGLCQVQCSKYLQKYQCDDFFIVIGHHNIIFQVFCEDGTFRQQSYYQ